MMHLIFLPAVPANCSTAFWDPIGNQCLCTSSDCQFTDESRPIGVSIHYCLHLSKCLFDLLPMSPAQWCEFDRRWDGRCLLQPVVCNTELHRIQWRRAHSPERRIPSRHRMHLRHNIRDGRRLWTSLTLERPSFSPFPSAFRLHSWIFFAWILWTLDFVLFCCLDEYPHQLLALWLLDIPYTSLHYCERFSLERH